ncbi:amidase family protein [Bacillus niameyensis]|uniref:amidase family protein n=1 Tax=Bacillus niameyensis TaxID=1522308 RepID=UPI000ADD9D3C|nr:amidase family protein [Bacillus niameyensis]
MKLEVQLLIVGEDKLFYGQISLIDTIIKISKNKDSLTQYFNDFYKRYSEIEPQIKAFIPEKGFKERIEIEATNLLEKCSDQDQRSIFLGIPFAVKDIIHVDGFQTCAGSKLPPNVLTKNEGSFIKKVRSMGGVIAGKTVTEEFAYHSVIPTRNPHNIKHTAGGSSAGSAASVAAGICPIAVGTQTLRSVIAPASFCGIVGFKPSYGRVPLDGFILLSPSFDTIGFFTKDIESLQFASSHLVPDWRCFKSDKKPVLGVPNGIYMEFMFDDVKRAFEKQLIMLEKAGYIIRNVEMPWDDAFIAGDAMIRMVQGEMAQVHSNWFNQYEHLYGSSVKDAINHGQNVPQEELEQYRIGQKILRNDLKQATIINGIDLWISPAQGGVAPKGYEKTGWSGMTAIWSYAGLPTISIPAIKINDMPLGFQCIGEYGKDEALLFWAKEIEHSLIAGGLK